MLVALLNASRVTVIDFAAYSGYQGFIFAYQLICSMSVSVHVLSFNVFLYDSMSC